MIAPLLLTALALACPATPVRTDAYAGEQSSLHAIPWVASTNGAFAAHLFYWGGTRFARAQTRDAAIFTASSWEHRDDNPKVLWIGRRATRGRILTISGRRLDASGSFRARYPRADGPLAQFPSYVEVPTAGCWRVTVRAGSLSGSVVFAAYDR